MAKKTTEKDVLIVRDEKTGEISVVAGLNADGSPKRTPAKAENAQSFLQFDRHGDVLDNFFKNFFRQCKEPSRFGFYRVAADQADKLLEVIKDLLKDPEGNKEMLAPHKVDTSGYEKKVQEEQSAEKQEQPGQKQDDEPKKQEEMEQKNEQNQENPQPGTTSPFRKRRTATTTSSRRTPSMRSGPSCARPATGRCSKSKPKSLHPLL